MNDYRYSKVFIYPIKSVNSLEMVGELCKIDEVDNFDLYELDAYTGQGEGKYERISANKMGFLLYKDGNVYYNNLDPDSIGKTIYIRAKYWKLK